MSKEDYSNFEIDLGDDDLFSKSQFSKNSDSQKDSSNNQQGSNLNNSESNKQHQQFNKQSYQGGSGNFNSNQNKQQNFYNNNNQQSYYNHNNNMNNNNNNNNNGTNNPINYNNPNKSFTPTSAVIIESLNWWVNEEEIRGWVVDVGFETDIKDVIFDEHKVNGKSKGYV